MLLMLDLQELSFRRDKLMSGLSSDHFAFFNTSVGWVRGLENEMCVV